MLISVQKFAEVRGVTQTRLISLGRGLNSTLAITLKSAIKCGHWVVLQNCHLAEEWLPHLENICNDLSAQCTTDNGKNANDAVHPDFRLWLVSQSSAAFPISVLQKGLKVAVEASSGLRSTLLRIFTSDPLSDAAFFKSVKKPLDHAWEKLLFGVCFFHGLLLERQRFGARGWVDSSVIFNDGDLRISLGHLRSFLLASKSDVPIAALNYVIGECNYGGRVTDEMDRRVLLSHLSQFLSLNILQDYYTFSTSGIYFAPPKASIDTYVQYVRQLPISQTSDLFGLDENAEIAMNLTEAQHFLENAVDCCYPWDLRVLTSVNHDELLVQQASVILEHLPPQFDVLATAVKFPLTFLEPMNAFLIQELTRFNILLSTIQSSVRLCVKSIQGFRSMSEKSSQILETMLTNRIPKVWLAVSYPSTRSLVCFWRRILFIVNL